MKYKDYYDILGVSRQADQEDVKRAYRKLARKFHPDVSDEKDAEARFKEVGEAYEVLKDREKRAAYDNLGRGWRTGDDFTPPPGWHESFHFGGSAGGGQFDFSDFFGSLFGDDSVPGAGFRHAGRAGARMRGRDEQVQVRISLKDAYNGAERSLQIGASAPALGARQRSKPRTLKLKIPRGVSEGQRIRLAGQGQPSPGGGPAGDLYLQVELLPHPVFRPERRDIYMDLPVTPWEAALGATVQVPTLGGTVDIKVPAGSQSGRKLRLKGRGLGGDGHQYAIIQLVTPPADSERAKEIYRKLALDLPYDPRSRFEK